MSDKLKRQAGRTILAWERQSLSDLERELKKLREIVGEVVPDWRSE